MNKEKKILAAIISSVAIVLLLLTTLMYRTDKFIENNRNTLYLISEVKFTIVNSHTWLEEAINGDTKEIDKLDLGFDNTNLLIEVILNKGEYKNRYFHIKIDDPTVISALLEIKQEVKTLTTSTLKRLQYDTTSGSKLDELHDSHFTTIIDKLNSLQEYILENSSKEYDSFAKVQYLIYLIIIALGFFSLYIIKVYRADLLNSLKKAKKNESRFLTLFNSSIDGIILIEDSKITDCNATASHYFNYTKEEFLQLAPLDLLAEQQNDGREKREVIIESYKKLLENQQIDSQLLFNTKENKHFIGETTITKTVIDKKEHILVIIRDISKDIEQDRLLVHQSKKAAMGEMLGAISHQLKQPINTLSLVSQELEFIDINEKSAKEEIKDAVKHINDGVLLMNETINDFRNFLKPDKNMTTFSLSKCINKVEDFVAKSYSEANISLEITNKLEDNIILKGIPSELQQVLLSILNNARDVIEEKRPKERVVYLEISGAKPNFHISINDSGGGVPHSLMSEIFTPYFTTKGDKGTGIGLFIAQKIVREKFGGNIQVENNNLGAKFTIKIKG